MKKCKACASQYEDRKNQCPNCGSIDYFTICENCGEAFDSGFCPNCGVKKGDTGKICPSCGKKYFSTACPDCGYVPPKSETSGSTQEGQKKNRIVGKVLLWIFFLPIMATIAVWKKQEWKLILKIGLTLLIWGACFVITAVQKSNSTTSSNTTSSTSQTTQVTDYIESSEAKTEDGCTGWTYKIKGTWEDYSHDQQQEIAFYAVKESVSKNTTADMFVWGENKDMPAFSWNLEDGDKFHIEYYEYGNRTEGKEANYRKTTLSDEELKELGIK